MAKQLSRYQELRSKGLCTRDCGRKGALVSHRAIAIDGKRHSECDRCRKTSHGRGNKR